VPRDAPVLFGRVEILGVVRVQSGSVAGLAGEPEEEIAQVLERGADRGGAQQFAIGTGFDEAGPERSGLLHAKLAEGFEAGRFLKPGDGTEGAIDGGVLLAGGGLQIEGIGSFYFLVFAPIFRHDFTLPQSADWNRALTSQLGAAPLTGLKRASRRPRP
jgi:hypothetical protein